MARGRVPGMDEMKPASPYGVIRTEDVDATLKDLPLGAHTARSLYARYEEIVKAAGRAPAHPVALGQALKRAGLSRRKVFVDGKQQTGWTY